MNCRCIFSIAALLFVGQATALANPYRASQPDEAPEEVVAVVEIPAGSFSKYELDPASGLLVLDRFQSMPVVYPANYGFLPSTSADDGDPLDVLVLSREPIVPTALIRVRPIGMLRMIDGGEADDKIIAVPAPKVDPHYADVHTLDDLPAIELQRIEKFFLVYKDLPAGRKKVDLNGFEDADGAREAIQRAIDAWKANNNAENGAGGDS